MIFTTYFAKLKSLPSNTIPISICGKAPNWHKGLQYKKLAPKYQFFMEWKKNHDNDYYIRCFTEQVLDTIDIDTVLNDIWNLLPAEVQAYCKLFNCPFWANPNWHILLVCYEKPTDFCHRHLVAEWMKTHNIPVKEWQN